MEMDGPGWVQLVWTAAVAPSPTRPTTIGGLAIASAATLAGLLRLSWMLYRLFQQSSYNEVPDEDAPSPSKDGKKLPRSTVEVGVLAAGLLGALALAGLNIAIAILSSSRKSPQTAEVLRAQAGLSIALAIMHSIFLVEYALVPAVTRAPVVLSSTFIFASSFSVHLLPLIHTGKRMICPRPLSLATILVSGFVLALALLSPPSPSPLSSLFFSYVDRPMLLYFWKASRHPFMSLVLPLPKELHSEQVAREFDWAKEEKAGGPLKGFVKANKWQVVKIWGWATIWVVALFISPLSMNLLLQHVQSASEGTEGKPYLYVLGLLFGPILTTISYQQALFNISQLGVRLRSALGRAIVIKLGRVRQGARGTGENASDGPGKVNNLVGTDIDVITASLEMLLRSYGVIPKLVVSLVFLYFLLGWAAFVAFGTIVTFVPLSTYVSKRYGGAQEKIMKATDKRVTLVNEALSSIKTIKIYAWERFYSGRISDAREVELKRIIGRTKVFGGMMLLSTGVPTAVTLTTFAAFTYGMKQSLVASTAFTSVSLFGLLREAVVGTTYISSGYYRAKVSLGRIRSFLSETEELDDDSLSLNLKETPDADASATIKFAEGATYTFAASGEGFKLEVGGLQLPSGGTTIIAGSVGSGKSAVLLAMLGEMHDATEGRKQGERTCSYHPAQVSTSYAAQSAWLRNETIRDNILMGQEYDEKRYKSVIRACRLDPDLAILEDGDETIVGERGTTLSGGQQQRIGLARAVYSKSSVVLLDDVLSAVDSETVQHIVEKCLGGPLLRGRTVVIVTHYVDLCLSKLRCKLLITMEDGKVADHVRPSQQHQRTMSKDSIKLEGGKDGDKDKKSEHEEHSAGDDDVGEGQKLSWKLYLGYFRSMGGLWWWLGYGVVNLVAHLLMMAQSAWIGYWVNQPDRDPRLSFYFAVYGIIQVVGGVSLTAMYLILLWGAVKASRVLHHRLITAIFAAPLRWFDRTPLGRILNRFSRDMETIDTEIVESLQPVLDYAPQVAIVATVIIGVLPIFLLPAFGIAAAFYLIGRVYITSALAARKHVAAARSPLFSTLGEIDTGVITLRAYADFPRFERQFLAQTDAYNRIQLFGFMLDRWLEQRADMIGAFVAFLVGMLAIRGGLNPGTTGFLVSTGLEFTSRILYVIQALNKNELSLNSAHRVIQYSQVEGEERNPKEKRPPASWPNEGAVSFDQYSVRYGEESPDVLKKISLDVRGGTRIGVVGATGSGKSSTALSLLRLLVTSSGKIVIDGLDIETVPRVDLRSRVTLIPQEPVLFSGTIRSNLDPYAEHEDADLWSALKSSRFVGDDEKKVTLDSPVSTGGSNLSLGQRQLFSLSRALARDSRIVIMDESTASVDNETDKLIQKVIREELKDSTLLTIAHRIESVIDFDRILVLKDGEVAECDTPKALLDRHGSFFYKLVQATGDYDHLYSIASGSSKHV